MAKQKKAVTIIEVARQAGVSISTVSRVLNNPGIVRADTRDRVQAVISELNFIPDSMARGLGSKSMRTVAIIVPNIVNSSMAEIVRGAMSVFREHDVDTMLFNSEEDPDMERRHYEYLAANMIHGVIFITSCGADVDFPRIAGSMPVVLVDREERYPRVDSFLPNDAQGIAALYNHLKEQGHTRIAMIPGKESTRGAQRRLAAFREMLRADGVESADELVEFCPWSMEGGREAFRRLRERNPRFTALICGSDGLALGAMGLAYELGLRIPEDLAITGFDNAPEGAYMSPSLTTLDFPNFRMGCDAARAVMRRYEDMNRPAEYASYPLHLKVRSSSTGSRRG